MLGAQKGSGEFCQGEHLPTHVQAYLQGYPELFEQTTDEKGQHSQNTEGLTGRVVFK